MSRVDKARQRAAEFAKRTHAEAPTRGVDLEPLPSPDTENLALDTFPFEGAAGNRRRVATHRTPASGPYQLVSPPPFISRSPDHVAAAYSSASWFSALESGMSHKIVGAREMSPASHAQYRLLAATMHKAQSSGSMKVIMIASAVGGEGKTLTAANLALTFSETYQRRVLLVDADLRRPSLHALFGVNNCPGLAEALTSSEERDFQVRQVTNMLAILTAGSSESSPIAVLSSERMRRLLQAARKLFEWIVLDTPPVTLLSDASLLASMVDGAVIVVKAESTPIELVEKAVAAIGKEKTLGFVLNAVAGGNGVERDYSSRFTEPGDAAAERLLG